MELYQYEMAVKHALMRAVDCSPSDAGSIVDAQADMVETGWATDATVMETVRRVDANSRVGRSDGRDGGGRSDRS